jgi:hypothetical protein
MEPGIHYVIFKSHTGRFGDGLAVVDTGKIHRGISVICTWVFTGPTGRRSRRTFR